MRSGATALGIDRLRRSSELMSYKPEKSSFVSNRQDSKIAEFYKENSRI